MSIADSSLKDLTSTSPDGIDLGLQLPAGFDLQNFISPERLLRLHPNWFVTELEGQEPFFTAAIKDYVTEDEFSLAGSFVFNGAVDELLTITLSKTIDIRIVFLRRDNRLMVKVISAAGELEPTDPLLLWIRAIREYIRIYAKRTPLSLFFRLVMNRMVLQMNPSQRKICLMMARITFVEILVILFIVIGYVIFVL